MSRSVNWSSNREESAGLVRERILAVLGERILSGHYPQDSTLPTENELSREFGVSRTVMREAVKMLAAKGLLVSRQRAGTRVRKAADWNRLDADVLDWMGRLEPDPEFVRGLIEARQAIEPAAARLAAMRATLRDLARIEEAYARMRETPLSDLAGCAEADVAFHVRILEASHNPVFEGLSKLIREALAHSFRVTTGVTENYVRTLGAHGEVLEAIRMRQPEIASERMRALIQIAAFDLIRHLSAQSPRPEETAPQG